MAVTTSRPVTPEGQVANGLYSGVQTPRTPLPSGLALTEYTANPSPPQESAKSKAQSVIPAEFLLPNGFPDVQPYSLALYSVNCV